MPKAKKKQKKQAAYSQQPTTEKQPSWVGPKTVEGGHISWRFSSADNDGPWAWPAKVTGAYLKRIVERLAAFEAMPHGHGIKGVRSIVPRAMLAKPAKQRLTTIRWDDIDELFGWHVGGLERLWCAAWGPDVCFMVGPQPRGLSRAQEEHLARGILNSCQSAQASAPRTLTFSRRTL